MSKQEKDNLFDLIKSLNQSEKRNFKLFASKGKEATDSIILFDLYDSMTVFNAEKFGKLIKKKALDSNINYKNHYLVKLILKSLDNFYSNNFIEDELRRNLHLVEILFEKTLYPICNKLIDKSYNLSEKSQLYFFIIQFLNWKRTLLQKESDLSFEGKLKLLKKISLTQNKAIKNEELIKLCRDIYDQLQLIVMNSSTSRNKKSSTHIIGFKTKLLELKINNSSLVFNFYYYRSLRMICLYENDLEKAYSYSKILTTIFENQNINFFSKEQLNLYANILTYYSIDLAFLKKEDEFNVNSEKLKLLFNKHTFLEKNYFLGYHASIFILMGLTKKFTNIHSIINEYETKLNQYIGSLPFEYVYVNNFNIACLLMDNKDYKSSLKWINKVINDYKQGVREDIYVITRFLSLISHYELNNHDVLDYQVVSIYRYLLKRNKLYKSEETMLNFIRKSHTHLNNKKSQNEEFKNLITTLEQLKSNKFELPFFNYFDFIGWLKSKTY